MVVWALRICFRLTDNELIVPDYSGITVGEPSKLRLDMMEIHGLTFLLRKKYQEVNHLHLETFFSFKEIKFFINPK